MLTLTKYAIISLVLLLSLACSSTKSARNNTQDRVRSRDMLRRDRTSSNVETIFYGQASYYADKFHGRTTANGEIFDMNGLTAAHKTLPFGTICRITNLENNKSVIVRINDRGPFVGGRVIDLSKGAAMAVDGLKSGVFEVKIEILEESE
jgi:rare lipoprotein A